MFRQAERLALESGKSDTGWLGRQIAAAFIKQLKFSAISLYIRSYTRQIADISASFDDHFCSPMRFAIDCTGHKTK